MRTYPICLALALMGPYLQAQNPGAQAAQAAAQASQMAVQISVQTSAQAMRDSQQAMQIAQQQGQAAQQAAQQASQQAARDAQCVRCGSATPGLSVKSGTYSLPLTVTISAARGATIYYTTDGWTPTADSLPYTGSITIDSTTTLQAIAISYGRRSRVASAIYTLNGIPAAPATAQNLNVPSGVVSNAAAAVSASGKMLLARGMAVPLVFASDVTSKTAHVGDKITLTLAEDLKTGDVVAVKKGTPSAAIITEVDKPHIGGMPGEVVFKMDSLQADGTVIKLHGTAAKEGADKVTKARALMVTPVPVGLFVHGKDAEIKQGTAFTAYVDADTELPQN